MARSRRGVKVVNLDTVDMIAQARQRAGMYVGSTGESGARQLVLEVVSNAIDLVVAGKAAHLRVDRDHDGAIVVSDDGPGFPMDVSFIHDVLSTPSSAPTRDGHVPHIHLDLGGIGLWAVNALCRRIELRSSNGRSTLTCVAERGVVVQPCVITDDSEAQAGTSVRLWPDPSIFREALDPRPLVGRLDEVACLVHGVTIDAFGEHLGPTTDLAPLLRRTWKEHWGPELDDALVVRHFDGAMCAELALAWASGMNVGHHVAYCNFNEMTEHGSDDDGLAEGLRLVFGEAPIRHVMRAGLVSVLSVTMLDPAIGGPTRGRLDDRAAIWLVADAVAAGLSPYLADRPELDRRLRDLIPRRAR
jgi:DNA gyrase subunit B